MRPKRKDLAVLLLSALVLGGCAANPLATTTTSSTTPVSPQPPVNTPASRVEHLGWNSAWARACGFYFDRAKLRSSYLTYETQAGTPPEQVAKLGSALDRLQVSIGAIAASQADQCSSARLDRIRAAMARYLAGDFTPAESA